ncbi:MULTISPECIES: cytochrome c [unclassified Roseitalea]|uniref:c-type cytochrome n=1 Tax=unclassified Roseitalea TaxID=2639107 RepID=UPI00273F2C44|nr:MULTISPECIES: cytochrome c [unclassified Roseitalea]
MPFRQSTIAAMIVAATAATAVAQDDVIEQRQQLMKDNGQAMRVLVPMARGQAEYDAEAALAAFVSIRDSALVFGDLFPEGSETGGDTRAKPEIWSDREGFDAAVAAFIDDTEAAVAAAPADLDAFRPVFGAMAQNCGDCHEVYQVPED